jgi:pimeloyl-ACP methyl ester carboxylesterase
MEEIGSEQAAILATSYNAMGGLVLAAEYPERVRGLVLINGTARVLWAPD